MTFGKLLLYLGIILIVYGVISGFYFHYYTNSSGSTKEMGYTFKFGTVAVGVILAYLGKRLNSK